MADRQQIEREARETYERFVEQRERVDAGELGWESMADFFTADAVYIDPAWGRQEGRETIRQFFVDSMAGLTGHGWSTPERWTMSDGHRLVSHWDQLLGEKPDGSQWRVPGIHFVLRGRRAVLLQPRLPEHDVYRRDPQGDAVAAAGRVQQGTAQSRLVHRFTRGLAPPAGRFRRRLMPVFLARDLNNLETLGGCAPL